MYFAANVNFYNSFQERRQLKEVHHLLVIVLHQAKLKKQRAIYRLLMITKNNNLKINQHKKIQMKPREKIVLVDQAHLTFLLKKSLRNKLY